MVMYINICTIQKLVMSTKNIDTCSKPIAWNHNCDKYIQISFIQQASPKVHIGKDLLQYFFHNHFCYKHKIQQFLLLDLR